MYVWLCVCVSVHSKCVWLSIDVPFCGCELNVMRMYRNVCDYTKAYGCGKCIVIYECNNVKQCMNVQCENA